MIKLNELYKKALLDNNIEVPQMPISLAAVQKKLFEELAAAKCKAAQIELGRLKQSNAKKELEDFIEKKKNAALMLNLQQLAGLKGCKSETQN